MPSGLPTAPDRIIGFQPPPRRLKVIPRIGHGIIAPSPGDTFLGGEEPVIFNPVILVLIGYLEKAEPKALDKAIEEALTKIPKFMEKLHIHDVRSFLEFANDLLKWTPHENFEGKDIYDILCMFYFILDQPSLSQLQTPINPNQVGKPLTWLSSWIVVYAQLIGLFMDTPASWTKESEETFRTSKPYNYHEWLIPEGGYRTFNDFFSRHLKPGLREPAHPDDDKYITYPADCTFDRDVEKASILSIEQESTVRIKGIPWTIRSLLQGSNYADEFEGGIWMHAFLNTYNYHRQHAPVSGKVIEAINIQGAAYLEVDSECHPVRTMGGQNPCDPNAPDTPGYQFLQTRGMIIIDNPVLGLVAVLPIGMAMVSSVKLLVHEGKTVKKGEEISYFQFGGSDVICVFQAKAGLSVDDFVASPKGTYSKTGTVLAKAP